MESATILAPHSTGLSGFLLSVKPNIPEGPKNEKYQHYIDAREDIVPTPRQLLRPLNYLGFQSYIKTQYARVCPFFFKESQLETSRF